MHLTFPIKYNWKFWIILSKKWLEYRIIVKFFVVKDFVVVKYISLEFQIKCIYFWMFAFWNIAHVALGEFDKHRNHKK